MSVTQTSAPTREDFTALLNETYGEDEAFEGSVVKGKVVAIEKDMAVIDVGLKTEGRVALKEFTNHGRDPAPGVGDEVEVYLERIENALGEAVISRDKARREESWVKLEQAFEKNEKVEGVIFNQVKGGFTVDLDGAVAFLPRSQVDIRPVRDVAPLMNVPQPFQILKMDRRRGNIVVSRRTVLEESRAEQRHEIVANLVEGQVIDGTVKNLTDYGAFVDLGGIDGLLHVTDIAWRRVNHPSEVLTIGQQVKVRIIKINHETHRISLGMKQLQEDPWSAIEARYQVGQKLKGRVTNIADYGAFVELEPGIEGLIHVSEMSWTKKNVHPGKIVSTSQEVEVQVLEVDASKRRISLGLKQTLQNPWEAFAEKHPVGSDVEGEVKNKTEFGLFIGLDGDVDGMVHLSDLDWTRPGEQAIEDYKKGDKVHAKVLDVDVEKERIAIGIKQLASDPFASKKTGAGPRRRRRGRTAQGLGRDLRGRRSEGRRDRGEDRGHGSDRLHQAQRARARPRRPAPRAVLGRREGRRAHHPVRPPRAQSRRLDQGARSRRGEGGDRPVRLGRLGRLARRHSGRGPQGARPEEVTAEPWLIEVRPARSDLRGPCCICAFWSGASDARRKRRRARSFRRALAFDDPEPEVDPPPFGPRSGPADDVENDLGRALRHLVARRRDRAQRRAGAAGELQVVEADDRKIVGNANLPPLALEQHAKRQIVVAAKDGRRRRRAIHQLGEQTSAERHARGRSRRMRWWAAAPNSRTARMYPAARLRARESSGAAIWPTFRWPSSKRWRAAA